MAISVAYDITMPANYFNRFDCKSGIFRVIEEVMYELFEREDIELTLVGLGQGLQCDELLWAAQISSLYFENLKSKNCSFNQPYKSKLGLAKFYKRYFDNFLTQQLQKSHKLSQKWILIRVIRKFLYSIRKWDVVPYLNYEKFDVFHSPYLKLPPEHITGGIPRVLTVYDLIPVTAPELVTSNLTAFFKEILGSVNQRKDWAVCISEYTKQEFCEYMKIPPERVFVAPLAAASHFYPVRDTDRIATVCRKYRIPEGNYFLSLAAPQPRKNLTHLIHCFFRLLADKPDLDINLVLVGSKDLGWMYDDIFVAAQASEKHSSRVIFTGYIPDEDLSEVYSGAKAFIFPSLYEGFGLPPLEAMQCGTPVITSNTTSLPEVVGDAGILVNPKDEDSLCQAMLDILSNTALCQRLSQNALVRSSQFSWAKCAADTIEVYKAAIAAR